MAIFPRHIGTRLRQAPEDTPIVFLAGPRQGGKTILAKAIASDDRAYLTLDNTTTLAAARADPIRFVRSMDRAVIDEAQRAPDLLLTIRESVDADHRPRRFLLTGSANLMTLPMVADSLAERMETKRVRRASSGGDFVGDAMAK